jgi:hypothetical protein
MKSEEARRKKSEREEKTRDGKVGLYALKREEGTRGNCSGPSTAHY